MEKLSDKLKRSFEIPINLKSMV